MLTLYNVLVYCQFQFLKTSFLVIEISVNPSTCVSRLTLRNETLHVTLFKSLQTIPYRRLSAELGYTATVGLFYFSDLTYLLTYLLHGAESFLSS